MKRHAIITSAVLAAAVGLGSANLAFADSPDPSQGRVTFGQRMKFEQRFIRIMKIHSDRDALPLDNETLTTMLNSEVVAGAAAMEQFGLDADRYGTYIRLESESNPTATGAMLARVTITLKADQRVPEPMVSAFTDAVSRHLAQSVNEAIRVDRQHVRERHRALLTRRQVLEGQQNELREQRIDLAERSGLAEMSRDQIQRMAADLTKQQQQYEIEIEARRARLELLEKKLADEVTMRQLDPMHDTIAKELNGLVQARKKQVRALTDAGAAPDVIAQAEGQLAEAVVRWATRIEQLEERSPRREAQRVMEEIADFQARQQYCVGAVATLRSAARDMYRYGEGVTTLAEQEARLAKRLEELDKLVDDLYERSENIDTVSVTILGQDDEPASAN